MKTLVDQTLWKEILLEALSLGKRGQSSAVPGSKLRGLVADVARARGQTFPPPEVAGQKFGKFLAHFQAMGCIVIRLREGQDVLVAPIDEPERLVEAPGGLLQAAGLRRDLFSAFSTVSQQRACYNQSDDKFVWLSETEPMLSGHIPVPLVTFDKLIKDCVDFVAELAAHEHKTALTEQLNQPRPLAAFTSTIRDLNLQGKWHAYRIKRIIDRVSNWTSEHNIAFQSAWITNSVDGKAPTQVDSPVGHGISRDWRTHLSHLIQTLSDDDLARVTVPMDVVARLLAAGR